MKKFFLLLSVITLSLIYNKSQAQISVGYYHSNFVSEVSVGTSPEKRIFGEVRVATDTDDFGLQVMGAYNFIRKEQVRVYFGVGLLEISGVPILTDDPDYVTLPIGIQVTPFADFKNFAFQFEVSPLVEIRNPNVLIKGGIGFRYTF